jgi:hypothetical protein
MLIKELPHWPPIVGGAIASGSRFPGVGEGVLNGVYPPGDNHQVTFSFTFEGHEYRGHFYAESAELAEKITELLGLNVGKTVMELGELKVDAARPSAQ